MGCRISANLITLNEEGNLTDCLESLRWTDEIVVIDGGSQDRTVELARRYTDRVFSRPFDDYARQRNRAIDVSTGDWIFSIDADERVPVKLAEEIRRTVAGAPAGLDGCWIPIRSSIFARRFRFSGTQYERKMRLFRRAAGRWGGTVHERVSLAGRTGQLRHAIEHHSTPDVATYMRKLEGYSAREADRLMARGQRPRAWRRWLAPAWTFAKLYLGKLGMFDGLEGLHFCLLSGMSQWVVEGRLREKYFSPGGGHVVGCSGELSPLGWQDRAAARRGLPR